MGIFSRRKQKDTPKNSLSTNRPFFFGRSTSDVSVNERTSLQTAAVYACVRVISEAVASLPLHLYRYEGNGSQIDYEHPLYDLLHAVPNPEMTSFVWRETMMSHILLWGNCFIQIVRDGAGRIKWLYPLMPDKMEIQRNEHGELYYIYNRDKDETRPHDKTGEVVLSKRDVLHIPGLGFDGLIGYSPIAAAKNAIGISIAAENYGATFFANGANPSGVLMHAGTLNDPPKIRDMWESIYRGKGQNRIAVLEDGLKFETVSIAPNNAQFLETRRFQLNEIARIFKVPPHMICDLEKSSFSNITQQSLEFMMHTIEPWVIKLEQSMDMALFTPQERRKYFIKFNLDGFLRGDYKSRMEGYAVARQNGWMSANEIRALERMNPIPAEDGGDRYMVNAAMYDLGTVGKPEGGSL